MTIDVTEWQNAYKKAVDNPPVPGDILVTQDGSPVKLCVELDEGKPPFIFGRAFVPETIGSELSWFLHDSNMNSYHGWKCIIMPRARSELMKHPNIQISEATDTIYVKSLKVVRLAHSGQSLLCEVHEYLPEATVVEGEVDNITEDTVTKE